MHYNGAMMHRFPARLPSPGPKANVCVPAIVPEHANILLFLYRKKRDPGVGCKGRSGPSGLVCFLHYPTACMP